MLVAKSELSAPMPAVKLRSVVEAKVDDEVMYKFDPFNCATPTFCAVRFPIVVEPRVVEPLP